MSDLISRADAISVLDNFTQTDALGHTPRQIVEALPSAQPEMDEWCDDCKEYDTDKHCCPRWNRVIREAVGAIKANADADTQRMQDIEQAMLDKAYECGQQDAMQWIPCNEEMPEEDNETGNGVQYSNPVLITVFNKEDEETIIDFAHTADGTWYSYVSDCSIPHGWKVIAWMPLPEPYKGEKHD